MLYSPLPRKKLIDPSILADPATCNFSVGLIVPIPKLPEEVTVNRSAVPVDEYSLQELSAAFKYIEYSVDPL